MALYKAIKSIFPNIRLIGCFYYYCWATKKEANKRCNVKDKNNKLFDDMITDLFNLPFNLYDNDFTKINIICTYIWIYI